MFTPAFRAPALAATLVLALGSAASADVFNYTGAIQTWIVPTTGLYTVAATGANGGSTTFGPSIGGRGAVASGELFFSAGTSLSILVGGRGNNPSTFGSGGGGGGGGGSFVVLTTSTTPLVVAGGGGGIRTGLATNGDGLATTSGGAGSTGALGGINGLGGASIVYGAGGGGFVGDGASFGVVPNTAFGGLAFISGGTGGVGENFAGGMGGFGGGGGGGAGANASAGGGGGFSGGGAGPLGGGGGSYLDPAALNQILISGGNAIVGNHGRVEIVLVPAPGGVVLLGGVVVTMRRRRR